MKLKTMLLFISAVMIFACTGNLCESECVNLDERPRPAAPNNVKAIAGNASALLTWDKVDNADYEYILSWNGTETQLSPGTGYFTVGNLENGKTYEFSLFAKKDGNLTSDTVKVTATPSDKLNVIPETPVFNVWFYIFDADNYPKGSDRTGYNFLNEGGSLTDGIVTHTEELINKPNEVSKLVIKYSSAAYAILRDGEDVHWFTMKKDGYRWEVWGYIYNVAFENSTAPSDETITELELPTAIELQKYNVKLNNGVKITTRGYYEENDGGAATYITALRSNKKIYSTMRTGTGQNVNYELQNLTINIRQFGAGHCTQITTGNENTSCPNNSWQPAEIEKYELNDDQPRFLEAMDMLSENNNDNTLETKIIVPAGEYRSGKQFSIGRTKLTIVGERDTDGKCKSIIYTDNSYETWQEFFFSVWGSHYTTIDSLRIEARETKTARYYRQVVVTDSTYVTIKNCEVYVDQHVQDDDSSLDRQYTNVTLYSGVKNTTVENCILTNLSGVERGACVGVMDFYGHGTENNKILNNVMYQNCHDEMMGIFSSQKWYAPDAYVHNILVSGNTMYPSDSTASRRVMAITIGYDDSYGLKDIVFERNHVIANIPSNLMTFGTLDNTAYIRDNIFDLTVTGSSGVIFDSRSTAIIENNTINFKEDSTGLCSVFKNKGKFLNNTVNVHGKIGSFSYLGGEISGNIFNVYNSIEYFTQNVNTIKNNTFNMKAGSKPVKTMFTYNSLRDSDYDRNDIEISGNTVNYDVTATDEAAFIAENNWSHNWGWNGFHCLTVGGTHGATGKKILFTNNTIKAPNVSDENKHLMFYSFKSDDNYGNSYLLQNNRLEKFTWVRNQMGVSEFNAALTYSGNTDLLGNKLDFNFANGVNYITGQGSTND